MENDGKSRLFHKSPFQVFIFSRSIFFWLDSVKSIRIVELNLLSLTRNKKSILNDFKQEYLHALNLTNKFLTFCLPDTDNELHSISYSSIRTETNLPSQIVQTARRDVWSKRRAMFNVVFRKVSVRLIKGDYRVCKSKRGNPLFVVTVIKGKRFALPVKKDKAYQRFISFTKDGWAFKSIMLLEKNGVWVIQAVLKKDFPDATSGKSILGLDVGSANLAAISVVKDKKILRQLYLGREVCHKQRKINERRAKLQSLADKGSHKAKRSLKRLKSYENDYVKTTCFQTAWKVIHLAKKFNSSISIEKLKNCRTRKGQFNKKANRKINKIPYFKLFSAIKSIAIREQIKVIEVNPRNTSRTCYKCGNVSKSNRKTQAFFKCTCGHTCNADINASVNIAHRAVNHTIQPIAGSPEVCGSDCVNQSLRSND